MNRIKSIDSLRGIVMILMLLDHVRETFYLHLQVSDPVNVFETSPELFYTYSNYLNPSSVYSSIYQTHKMKNF
jgi:uncharacterized membrane protein